MQAWFEHSRRLKAILATGDVHGALAFLNSLTEHRFTSLYRFDEDTLRNVYFYDRCAPDVTRTPDLPVAASYCVFVRNNRGTFSVVDAIADDRVDGHPKQHDVQAYCGVPLLDGTGRLFGTVCHFDLEPRAISPDNIDLMEAMAPMLQRYADQILAHDRRRLDAGNAPPGPATPDPAAGDAAGPPAPSA